MSKEKKTLVTTEQTGDKNTKNVSSDGVQNNSSTVVVPSKKSNKTLWIVLGLLFFFLFVVPGLLFTAGAFWLSRNSDKAVESLVEKATGGVVDIDGQDGSFSFSSEDGDSSLSLGSDQSLPDDFPRNDVPYLAEKSVVFVFTSSSDGKKNWSVTTTVSESVDEAKSYFENKIREPEYSSVSSYSFGDSHTYSGQSDKYNVSVSVTSGETSDTTVTYNVAEL